jgi:hypothetical protein
MSSWWPGASRRTPMEHSRHVSRHSCNGSSPVEMLQVIDWRREGDSNPRYGLSPYNGLANRRLQPLGHPSATRPVLRTRSGHCQSSPPQVWPKRVDRVCRRPVGGTPGVGTLARGGMPPDRSAGPALEDAFRPSPVRFVVATRWPKGSPRTRRRRSRARRARRLVEGKAGADG